MPFTVSHALAVLPLARDRRLVPAALVIGSWVPDLPYFVPYLSDSDWTHAASGPVTIDLLLGLMLLALWRLVLRGPLVDLAPALIRERVAPARRIDRAYLLGAVVSVVLGAVTHVVWDTFTHGGRWGTTHLPALAGTLGPLPVYKWLQFASGVIGMVGLIVWSVLWVRRTARRPAPPRVSPVVRRLVWGGVTVAAVLGAAFAGVSAWVAGRSLEAMAFTAITRSIGATGATVTLICLLWLVFARSPGRSAAMADESDGTRA